MLNIVPYGLIAKYKVVIDIIDYSVLDVRMLSQHMKEHSPATNKGLYISSVVPIV